MSASLSGSRTTRLSFGVRPVFAPARADQVSSWALQVSAAGRTSRRQAMISGP